MNSRTVSIKIPRSRSKYDVRIGGGLLSGAGSWAADALGCDPGRVLIVSNRKVFGLYGGVVEKSFASAGFKTHVHLIGDGERFKNLRTLEDTLRRLGEEGFTRTDTVVALGGGVVGDLASFAASIYLRGLNLLQIPTTLLSMIDSSVGGKTAVNTSFGKNLVGSFYQPDGVLVDVETLGTLPRREMTAGFCEAVKQGAISGPKLFRQTAEFLEIFRPNKSTPDFAPLIAEHIAFKARIVQQDETESAENLSPTSRKILNFGHTFGHALEKSTDYSYLKHGEAVGYGILFAAQLSKSLELLSQDTVNSLNDVVRRAGVLPAISHIDQSKVLESFRHDKKRIGNSLHWVLLHDIGKPVIVPDTGIPRSKIKSTLRSIFQK